MEEIENLFVDRIEAMLHLSMYMIIFRYNVPIPTYNS